MALNSNTVKRNSARCRHDFSAHREHVLRSMTPYVDAARRVAADTCQLAVIFIAILVLVDVSATLVWMCLHRSVSRCLSTGSVQLIESLLSFRCTLCNSVNSVQSSSVTEFVSRSLIIKIMTAALTRSSCVSTFQFSADRRIARVSVMSSLFPATDLFHADGPATEKLRGPKPTVLVRGTTRSP